MLQLKVVNAAGVLGAELPSYTNLRISPVFCDVGAVEFEYAIAGVNAGLLNTDVEVTVLWDGTELPDCRFIIDDIEGDEIKDTKLKYTGRTMLGYLIEAKVYPSGWPGNANPPSHSFSGATAGTILSTLVARAKDTATYNRGALLWLDISTFSGATDSNGVAWTKTLSVTYDAGVDYLQVIQNLVAQQVCEVRMVGRVMKVYNPGTLTTDRTTANPPMVLRKGRDISEAPRHKSVRNRATARLIAGANNVYRETSDAVAQAAAGRRVESYESQGGISDTGTLDAIVQADLARISSPKLEKTHGLVMDSPTNPKPLLDFQLGDYVYSDVGNGLERYRVVQAVLSTDERGKLSASATLNDYFSELEVQLSKKVDGIIGGSTIAGGSDATVTPYVPDATVPNAPATVTATSATYVDTQGNTLAQITVSWAAVTQNTDTTAITDLDHYEVQVKKHTDTVWSPSQVVPGASTSTYLSGFVPGILMDIQVRAVDKTNHQSTWAFGSVTTAIDNVAPNAPSTPTIDVSSFANILRITWDGLDSGGLPMAADTAGVDVHVSTVSGFAPSYAAGTSTLRDQLPKAGVSTLSASAGTPYYVKLVARDRTGNISAASTQATATPRGANSGEVASVNVGSLVAGSLAADITVAARIKTANTGARAEMDGTGFHVYASDGVTPLFEAKTDGTVTVQGTIKAGSVLPSIAFGESMLPNGTMEDIVSGGTLPTYWIVSSTTAGAPTTGMETVAPLSGAQSLYVSCPTNTAGAGWVNSYYLPVVVGEKLQLKMDFNISGAGALAGNSVYLGVLWYNSAKTLLATTPATTDVTGQAILNLDGSLVATPAAGSAAGVTYVCGGWTGWAKTTTYRAVGEVQVPAGAAYARWTMLFYTSATASAAANKLTLDNAVLSRSGLGDVVRGGYITGAWLRTAETSRRIEIGTDRGTTWAYNVMYFYTGWTSGGIGESIGFGPFYNATYGHPMQGYIAADATAPDGSQMPTGDACGTLQIQPPKIDNVSTAVLPWIRLQSAIVPGSGSATVWNDHSGSVQIYSPDGTKFLNIDAGQTGNAKVACFGGSGYDVWADMNGPGSAANRLWLDGPGGGAMYFGPRAGSSYLASFQIRTSQFILTYSGNVDFQIPLQGAPGGPTYRYLYQVTAGGTVNKVYGGVTVSSSVKAKRDIKKYKIDQDKLMALEPQKFRYKVDVDERKTKAPWNVGLMGEDLVDIFPELVHLDDEGEVVTVHYDRIGLMLIPVVRELRERLTEAERAIELLKA